jgi:N-acetylneuraminate synthase
MIVDRSVRAFSIREDVSLREALQAIDRNKEGFVFCVDEAGLLRGLLTDGDIRRWISARDHVDTSVPVSGLFRRDFVSARLGDSRERLENLFDGRVRVVPLLDAHGRLAGIARRRDLRHGIRIGERLIGGDAPVFVIAEIGINHNGCPDRARRLIDAAADAGVDCVKFQMRHMKSLYRGSADGSATAEDLGTQYTLNLLERFELPVPEMLKLFDHARRRGVEVLCTPWEEESLAVLEAHGMPGYKVASADLTNHPFLKALADTYKPLILSTGMASEEEIRQAADLLRARSCPFVLLHCISTYPAPFKDIHLKYMSRLREVAECPVGYSGHERGIHVAIAAAALGACVIEKHITEDRSLEGSDHRVSLLPGEFAELVAGIRAVGESLGTAARRTPTQGEIMNRVNLAKSLVASRPLRAGMPIERDMIDVRSPGRGLQPNRLDSLVGRPLRRDMNAGDFFFESDLQGPLAAPRAYQFHRPWGLTVRWHDCQGIARLSNPDFLEFHLSFKDMEEDFRPWIPEALDMDLKVHSPDTFPNDHLLDLANPDPEHRRCSIAHLQRVINLTRELTPWFRRATRPVIIASLGGFTENRLLRPDEVAERYDLMAESLSQLDSEGVEIVAQTLPPFPWYFGGQLFLNLFVHPEDTAAFCRRSGLRLCLDVCHSKMACNHFGHSFTDLIRTLGPHTAHLHMADARGVDGEGLQINEGDIDFPALCALLREAAPGASFIPEIWQGHKNNGEGFWLALERLEHLDL